MDVLNETIQTMREASQIVPGQPDPSTLRRWIRVGCRTRTGRTIYLGGAVVGGRTLTSVEAVKRFLKAMNAPVTHGKLEVA